MNKTGHEQTYDWVVKLLQECNFEDSAKRLNCKLISHDEVSLEFLGRVYSIGRNGIEISSQKIVWHGKSDVFEYNLKSVLGYYVLSQADLDPLNDFCTIANFSHGIFREGSFDDPLGKVIGSDYNKFCGLAEKLNFTFVGNKSNGQYIWEHKLLPKVPVQLVYYEGDDEYPTKIQILYDKTAIHFFRFEQLAVLNVCFISALAAIAEL